MAKRAIILNGTLKTHTLSNTQVLCEFFAEELGKSADCEIIKLADYVINPGTDAREGNDDEWPAVFEKIAAADIVVFATPVWWGSHSSLIQRIIERLDAVHDEILAGKSSALENKVGGVIATGDSDGAEHIIGVIANFYNAVGILLPAYASLTVLWDGQAKDKSPSRDELLKKYREEYSQNSGKMATQLLRYA